MKLKHYLCSAWIIMTIGLAACSTQNNLSNLSSIQKREPPLQTVSLDRKNIAMGQTIYVPIYSHIYHYNSQDHVMNLSATMSVRNTDSKNSIIITSVKYYDTSGQLIRQDIDRPVALNPLASTSFFIAADDTSGGSGANFMVEWVAEKPVSEPVVEAVMISTSSSQGISFVSPGKVVQQQGVKERS